MSTKRVSPAILPPLKEALTAAFWYKPDLRSFLTTTLSSRELVAALDWTAYKWSIVAQLVDSLAADQHRTFDELLSLILATADITDPAHLKRVDGGQQKYENAVEALNTLRRQVDPYRQLRDQQQEAERRREADQAKAAIQQAMSAKLGELRNLFYEIVRQPAQQRGYSLERLLNEIFALYDIDAKGPFRIEGEQIDGAFTHDSTEYLLEAKWQEAKTPGTDLSVFNSKIQGKLDNTLGLFVSINGFQDTAALIHSRSGRPVIILMDGADLSAVLEDRVSLPALLTRKRQHAARTGEIFLSAFQLLQ